MMQLILFIALIPIIHFLFSYTFAKKDGIIEKFRRNYAIMYLDWLFIFVNLSLALNNSFSWKTFVLFFILCIIPIFHLKKGWRDSKHKRRETTLFFDKNGNFNRVGISHTVFMLIQGTLALQFFFSHANNQSYYLGVIALLVYFVAYCFVIKYVRRLKFTTKVEMPYVIVGLILIILRLVWALHELTII